MSNNNLPIEHLQPYLNESFLSPSPLSPEKTEQEEMTVGTLVKAMKGTHTVLSSFVLAQTIVGMLKNKFTEPLSENSIPFERLKSLVSEAVGSAYASKKLRLPKL